MPASGLVLTLRPDPTGHLSAALATALAARPEVTLGPWSGDPARGGHLALVTDTPDRDADRALWDWLAARPEVLAIGLAFAHFDEPRDEPHNESAARADSVLTRLS